MQTSNCLVLTQSFSDNIFSGLYWFPFPQHLAGRKFGTQKDLQNFLKTFEQDGQQFLDTLVENHLMSPKGMTRLVGDFYLSAAEQFDSLHYTGSFHTSGKGLIVLDGKFSFNGREFPTHAGYQGLCCHTPILGVPEHQETPRRYDDEHLNRELVLKCHACDSEMLKISLPNTFNYK
jgi:hypothetical protein